MTLRITGSEARPTIKETKHESHEREREAKHADDLNNQNPIPVHERHAIRLFHDDRANRSPKATSPEDSAKRSRTGVPSAAAGGDGRNSDPLTLPRRFTILRLLARRADEVIAERARRLGTPRAFYAPRDLRQDLRAALLRVLPAGTQTYRLTHDLPQCAARFYGLAVGGAFAEGRDAAC